MTQRMLRPLALGDIFDEAFDLYKDNFLFFVLVTVVAAVPLKLVLGVLEFRFLRDFRSMSALFGGQLPDITQIFAMLGTVAGTLAILAPVYAIGVGLQVTALAAATSARYLGRPCTLREAYRVPLRRLGPLVLSALLFGLCLVLGACVCYLGLVVPLTLLAFTAHAFAVEDKHSWRFWQPLARSRRLVRGEGGRVFGALFMMGVVSLIVSVGIELPVSYGLHAIVGAVPGAQAAFGARVGAGLSAEDQIISQISEGLSGLVVLPFLVSVLTVLFYDLRVRKEAFDIDLLVTDLHYAVPPWVAPALPRRVRVSARPPKRVKEGSS